MKRQKNLKPKLIKVVEKYIITNFNLEPTDFKNLRNYTLDRFNRKRQRAIDYFSRDDSNLTQLQKIRKLIGGVNLNIKFGKGYGKTYFSDLNFSNSLGYFLNDRSDFYIQNEEIIKEYNFVKENKKWQRKTKRYYSIRDQLREKYNEYKNNMKDNKFKWN